MILSSSGGPASCVEDFHSDDVVAVVEQAGRSFFYAVVIGPASVQSKGPGGRVRVQRSDPRGEVALGSAPENRVARNLVLKFRDGKAV